MNISGSVGRGGRNVRPDVVTVQQLINASISLISPTKALSVDGLNGPKTIGAITEFQKRIVGLSVPDGRVDPNGRTIRTLNDKNNGGQPGIVTPAPNPFPAPGTGDPGGGDPGLNPGDGESPTRTEVSYSDSVPSGRHLVSDYAFSVIHKALVKAGMKKAVITSTTRSSQEQASIMYRNAKIDLAAQYRIYGRTGDKVLDVYNANRNKSKTEVVRLMREKIESELAKGNKTSKHVVSDAMYHQRNVIDIGVNSTRAVSGPEFNIDRLTAAFKALKNEGYVAHFVDETRKSNSCWHIEVVPDAKPL